MCRVYHWGSLGGRDPDTVVPQCFCRPAPRTEGGGVRWEDLRFLVEKELGLVWDDPQNPRAPRRPGQDTCVMGVLLEDYLATERCQRDMYALSDDAELNPLCEVVVIRVPTDDKYNDYVPASTAQHRLRRQATTDEERLAIAVAVQQTEWQRTAPGARGRRRCAVHPSTTAARRCKGFVNRAGARVAWAAAPVAIPEGYLCDRCFNYVTDPPHLSSRCPTLADPRWRNMSERLMPVGIPASDLVQVTEASEAAVRDATYAQLQPDGRFRLYNRRSCATPASRKSAKLAGQRA